MKCLVCGNWSFSHLCRPCRALYLEPSLRTRKILGTIPVHSFYRYDDIAPLLHTKHTDLGHYVYTLLARESFARFAAAFEHETPVAAVGIDDHVRRGYSHTAILARQLKSGSVTPRYGRLRARNRESYSGRSYQYRLLHPRRFALREFSEEAVILVDDILTTGLTLTQAAETLHRSGKRVLFALTLADAQK